MKPWEEMYRAVIRRLDEIVEKGESMDAVALIAKSHTGLMADYDKERAPTPLTALAGYSRKETATLEAMKRIAFPTPLPTDGAKITPGMLDSKADLQELINGAEIFRTVKTVEAIDVNVCPGATLNEPPHLQSTMSVSPNGFLLPPINVTHWDERPPQQAPTRIE
jgi:hypothetical protein